MSDESREPGCIFVFGSFLAGALLGVIVAGTLGVILGAVAGERGRYHARYREEREAVVPAIEKDPAFKAVEIEEKSDGGIELSGSVPTPADRKRLEEIVMRAIGETRANYATRGVDVDKKL
jgi:hypothetical protein